MFDITDIERGGFWSAKALHDLSGYWSDAIAGVLLEQPSATIRFSVYQFDQFRLRRLCRSTSDPKVLLDALTRLSAAIPAGQGFDLPFLEGVGLRPEDEPKALTVSHAIPWSRSLLATLAVLRDSATGPRGSARAVVLFSTGAEGTTVIPDDVVDHAVAADVPIYPVALPTNQAIRYEGYPFDPDGPLGFGLQFGLGHGGYGRFPQWGMCLDPDIRSRLRGNALPERSIIDCPLNVAFEDIGKHTGGRSFEAVRGAPPAHLPRSDEPRPVDRFSMTGAQVNEVLGAVKRHALARFVSTYTLWFTPTSAAPRRPHTLEVRLATKSSAKVVGSKRTATY